MTTANQKFTLIIQNDNGETDYLHIHGPTWQEALTSFSTKGIRSTVLMVIEGVEVTEFKIRYMARVGVEPLWVMIPEGYTRQWIGEVEI